VTDTRERRRRIVRWLAVCFVIALAALVLYSIVTFLIIVNESP